ncbi:MAG: potassium channel family protein [Solirubrobacterales bacterium]
MYRWIITLYRAFKVPEARAPLSAAVALLVTGTAFYMLIEGWSMVDAFYFSVTTLTTVGFGQPAPETDVGKIFTAFFVLSGVGMFLAVLNAIGIQAVKIQASEVPIGRLRRGKEVTPPRTFSATDFTAGELKIEAEENDEAEANDETEEKGEDDERGSDPPGTS